MSNKRPFQITDPILAPGTVLRNVGNNLFYRIVSYAADEDTYYFYYGPSIADLRSNATWPREDMAVGAYGDIHFVYVNETNVAPIDIGTVLDNANAPAPEVKPEAKRETYDSLMQKLLKDENVELCNKCRRNPAVTKVLKHCQSCAFGGRYVECDGDGRPKQVVPPQPFIPTVSDFDLLPDV